MLVNAVLDYILVFGIIWIRRIWGSRDLLLPPLLPKARIGVTLSFGGLMLGWYKVRVSFRDIYLVRWRLHVEDHESRLAFNR
jgi:hypothetical protein